MTCLLRLSHTTMAHDSCYVEYCFLVSVHHVHAHNMYSALDVHVICNNKDHVLVTSAVSTDII